MRNVCGGCLLPSVHSLVIDMKTNSITRCLPRQEWVHTHTQKHTDTHTQANTGTHYLSSKLLGSAVKLARTWADNWNIDSSVALSVTAAPSTLLSHSLFSCCCLCLAALPCLFDTFYQHDKQQFAVNCSCLNVWLRVLCYICTLSLSVCLSAYFSLSLTAFLCCFPPFALLLLHFNLRYFALRSTVNILNHSLDLASLCPRIYGPFHIVLASATPLQGIKYSYCAAACCLLPMCRLFVSSLRAFCVCLRVYCYRLVYLDSPVCRATHTPPHTLTHYCNHVSSSDVEFWHNIDS